MAEGFVEATDDTLAGLTQSDKLVLVDFYADWCMPCRMLAPTLESLATEYAGKITVVKVNTETCPKSAIAAGIYSIPTVKFFLKGKEVHSIVGMLPAAHFRDAIDTALKGQS